VVHNITRKELTHIANREGLVKAGLKLQWTDDVITFLAKEGFDARYGARPLQRVIETMVVAPLAKFLIEHTELSNSIIYISLGEDNTLLFQN
jgi:ATP-dependent Clp protease ATP-binding subunit ClpC